MKAITDINQLDPEKVYSYAEYLTWKLEEYVELFKGKVTRMGPAPLREHQRLAGNIFGPLQTYLKRKSCNVYIAPFDVRFPKKTTADETIYTVVQPDISIICDPAKLDDKGCIGAPDTIIEILSPGNINRDIRQKFNLNEEHGVPEYWIVAPGERTIAVYKLEAGKYELSGEYSSRGDIPLHSLPGFSLPWEDIFED